MRRLTAGCVLGRYEILAHVGSGGMGDVYRARDKALEKTVALKTVAAAYADDPDYRSRFERERKLSASLDHPHICRLLDAGHDAGTEYLAMEYLEGESLAARLERGPLPVADAIGYAIEMADALEYAHARGVVHRDLKPANVFLTRTGVKLLDFGLAKLVPARPGRIDRDADTVPFDATAPGTVVGSAPYIAPERLEGREADARTDVFGFGLVLYEMLTARRAFAGGSPAALIAAILSGEPAPLQITHPRAEDLAWLLRRCLAKDPELRWQTMADVKAFLRHLARRDFATPPRRRLPRAVLPMLAIAVAAASGALVGVFWRVTRAAGPPMPLALVVHPPAGGTFTPTEGSRQTAQVAIAPDGRVLAYIGTGSDGTSQVWVRRLDSVDARAVPGTVNATYPFWSPDGTSIGFFAEGGLFRVDLRGGPPRLIAAAPDGRGGAWSPDGHILFAPTVVGTIHRVSADGGAATPVTQLAGERKETSHRWPVFLPDGERFLYYAHSTEPALEGLYLKSPGEEARFLVNTDYGGAFLPPDRILFLAEDTLLAQDVDLARGRTRGDPMPVADHVGGSSNFYGAFCASANGVIAYASAGSTSDLVWMNREGHARETVSAGRGHVDFRLSDDGRLLALTDVNPATLRSDIYVIDLARGTRVRVITTEGGDASPVWAPDAGRLVFRSERRLVQELFVKEVYGTAPERLLYSSRFAKYPTSWSRDGQWIAFHTRDDVTRWDVIITPVRGGPPRQVLRSPVNERQAHFSPDGRWLAFTSDESKQDEVYVQSIGDPDVRLQVSVNGGDDPRWRSDGRELFYVSRDGYLVSAAVRHTGDRLVTDPPQRLFQLRAAPSRPPYLSSYDVTPDGGASWCGSPSTRRCGSAAGHCRSLPAAARSSPQRRTRMPMTCTSTWNGRARSSCEDRRAESGLRPRGEPRRHGVGNIRGDRGPVAVGVDHAPTRAGLPDVAFADAREQLQVALELVAIAGLAFRGYVGRDVEEERDVRVRQIRLHAGEPCRVEPHRLAVGDARRAIAVANEDEASLEPAQDLVLALVAVGDIQQLHHVGTVIALALQRARDLLADRRPVVGERQKPDLVTVGPEPIAQQLGLRLLAALIEPLERYQQSAHQVSSASTSSSVWRRRMTVHRPSSTRTSGASIRRL